MNEASTERGRGEIQGATLIELLIVVAIATVLALIAVPSYQTVVAMNRLSSEVNALGQDLQFARAESIRQGLPVVICAASGPTAGGATPAPSCSGAPTWNSGWIVFTDSQGSGSFDVGDPLLRIQDAFSGSTTADLVSSSTGSASLQFNRAGYLSLAAPTRFAFANSPADPALTRCIEVSAIGHLHFTNHGAGSCP